MEIQEKQIKLNGHTFMYREIGEASAPPIVALHALGKTSESWDQVFTVLGEKYRVLALDQRGHGGSREANTYSFELMCDDLLYFVDALNLGRFTLIGHSMGGLYPIFSPNHTLLG
ncbi:alpha/beta fold hydrolase [Solibacillus isronensis]|uniref:alpha/beta fold hydrolase n=1 Tax=Solibacillus isronensis TaxID=412383 RepID=UPI00333E35E5